jgi:hypothetical protein
VTSSNPIRVVENGFRSEFIPATWPNGRKQEIHLSLSTQINRSLPLELTLLDSVSHNPVDPELLHVALFPTAPTVILRGTAHFDVQISLLSLDPDLLDKTFVLRIQCPDAEVDIAPFYSRPIRVASENLRKSSPYLRQILDNSLRRHVIPLLHDILHHVSQTPNPPNEILTAPTLL